MTVAGLLLSRRILPSVRSHTPNQGLLEGYRGVLTSHSALACLLGNMLVGGAWAEGVVVYSVTYLRGGLNMSLPDASKVFSALVVGVLMGNYLGGLTASRLGVKRVIVASSLLTGILIIGYMNTPSLALTVVLAGVMSLTAGMVLTCANTLLLSQVPGYRGTVTSLNSAATQLGIAIGAAVGGVALSLFGWSAVGVAYGAMHVVAAAMYHAGVQGSSEWGG